MKKLLFSILLLSIFTPSFVRLISVIDTNANFRGYVNSIASNHKTIWVPSNYTHIQEAIDHADEGDTIIVLPGTYREHITLSKLVNLIGNNVSTTAIDGQGSGTVVKVTASNVVIEGFTVRNGEIGIYATSAGNCFIKRNNASNNVDGIHITSSWNCTIVNNNSSNNDHRGIFLNNSWECNVSSNVIEKNEWYGLNLNSSRNSIVVGNTVKGGHNDHDAIGLLSCTNCSVVSNTAEDSHRFGIWVDSSTNCVVDKNYVNNNVYGISIVNSLQCSIKQNDVINSQKYNLGLYSSSMNTFYQNNFIATGSSQVETTNSTNIMDNGIEGNYWSDYAGIDYDCNGIGDTMYVVDAYEHDGYPIMARFTNFPINRENETYDVNIISNSTLSNFEFSADKNEVKFQVLGEKDTYGFCRISIPKALMNGTLIIKVDSSSPIIQKKLEPLSAPLNYLYFTYIHSIHQVTITLEVHQDFLSQILVPLILVSAAVLVALLFAVRRKRFHLFIRRKK